MSDSRILVLCVVALGWGGALSVLVDLARGIKTEGGALVAGAAFVGFAGAYLIRREESEC